MLFCTSTAATFCWGLLMLLFLRLLRRFLLLFAMAASRTLQSLSEVRFVVTALLLGGRVSRFARGGPRCPAVTALA